MKKHKPKAITAAAVAVIAVSLGTLPSCEGRKMTNMIPDGETVEVVINGDDTPAVQTEAVPTSAEDKGL